VAISRAKQDLKIYADDKEKFLEYAQESVAKENPRELLQQQTKERVTNKAAVTVSQAAMGLSINKLDRLQKDNAKTIAPTRVDRKACPTYSYKDANHVAVMPTQALTKREVSPPTVNKAPLTVAGETVTSIHTAKQSNRVQVPKPFVPPVKRSCPPAPKKVEPFWIPISASQPPQHIQENHWHELLEGSAIHPEIAARNFRSLGMNSIEQEHEAWEYLMYSDKLERSNTGRLSAGMLNRYVHIEAGGWWCSAGVDPYCFQDLPPGQKPPQKIWGCYKPNTPRDNADKPGKKIKYEHPPKTELSIFLLDVPDEIAKRIYQQAGVNPSQSDRASGFWYCVWKHNLPVTITEGAKKAASLLSQGRAAIGLPGIYAGYRTKDEQGNLIKAHLHEELAVFATPGREIHICFDYETRPDTKLNIDIAISRTGSLLERQGAKVSVVNLPGPPKGVDDLIVAQGPLAYQKQERSALRLRAWREQNKQQQRLAPEPPKKLSQQSRKERLKAKLASKLTPEQQAVESRSQNLEQVLIAAMNHLSERDFLLLHSSVADYFKAAPLQPPSLAQRQVAQAEIEVLAAQIDSLWSKYRQQMDLVNQMEKKPFHLWSQKYKAAVAQAKDTMDLISQSVAQKQHKEHQLQQWDKQAEAYQAWEKDPCTIEMSSIAQVLGLPQMQSRFTNIQQEQKRQEQTRLAASRRNQQQQQGQRRGLSC